MPDNTGKSRPTLLQRVRVLPIDFVARGLARQFRDERESATTGPLRLANIEEWWCTLRRPAISAKVIKELLRLGYLQPAKRFKPHIVERALVRLRADLVRDGVVKGGNSLSDPISSAADDSQPSASVPGTSS
jgi:hypothetical protein